MVAQQEHHVDVYFFSGRARERESADRRRRRRLTRNNINTPQIRMSRRGRGDVQYDDNNNMYNIIIS